MKAIRIAIVGTPRSGSSYFASELELLGLKSLSFESPIKMNSSQFNIGGYYEDTYFNLLTDQLIRYSYGDNYSFLNPPLDLHLSSNFGQSNWSFDLDEHTIEIPPDYEMNIKHYCGHAWDVWGLTRMLGDGKWNKVYAKLGISNSADLQNSVRLVKQNIQSKNYIYIKDARLIFVLSYFTDLFSHIIFLTREHQSLANSIRSHYGPRIFLGPKYENFEWVSNHFNYKIPFMTLEDFILRYESAVKFHAQNTTILRVDLDSIDTREKMKLWLQSAGLIF